MVPLTIIHVSKGAANYYWCFKWCRITLKIATTTFHLPPSLIGFQALLFDILAHKGGARFVDAPCIYILHSLLYLSSFLIKIICRYISLLFSWKQFLCPSSSVLIKYSSTLPWLSILTVSSSTSYQNYNICFTNPEKSW